MIYSSGSGYRSWSNIHKVSDLFMCDILAKLVLPESLWCIQYKASPIAGTGCFDSFNRLYLSLSCKNDVRFLDLKVIFEILITLDQRQVMSD